MASAPVTLDQLIDAIVSMTRAQFPDLVTVEVLRQDPRLPPVPACLIEFTEADCSADNDDGSDRLPVVLRLSATFVLSFRQQNGANPAVEAAKLALAFAAFAKNQRWGLAIGAAQLTGVYQDAYVPAQEQYECFRVDWTQEIQLGTNAWAMPEGVETPDSLWAGFAPNIGAAHVDDYALMESAWMRAEGSHD